MSSQLQVSGEAKIRSIQGPVVANSGVITALNGSATQYVRGDGALADFPTSTGGGSSVSYYLNSSISQGTIGGVAYRQLSKTPISGAGTDIAASTNGYIASYITDANDPALLEVPAGNFNCEFYFSVNSNSHNPYVYAELYKYDGTTFTLLGSNVAIPEYLTNGTTLSAYYFAIPVAVAALTITDRLAIRIYVNVDGRTVTLHTENSHLCQVVTTFSKGLISLNNLTRQNQFFGTGTSGTDFAISSSVATHTFNLPVASAANTGKLSSTDWSTFNNKQAALSFTAPLVNTSNTISIPVATSIVDGYLDNLDWSNFNTAYNNMIVSAAVTGTTTKTLTLTQQDAGTITASWTDDNTDAVTSVFGRTGAVVAVSGDYNTSQVTENTNLYFTDSRARLALSFAAGSGAYNSTTGVITIPTNNNQITNGSNFITLTSLSGGTGISYNNTTGVITNSAPDQTVALTNGTGISVTGTYPNFTITNTSPSSGGTVTSVAMSVPTGLSVSGSPITSSGTLGVTFTAGYSIPTDASQTTWDTAYTNRITSASFPLSISSNAISISLASASTAGYLSIADWNTFNGKGNGTVTGVGLSSATSGVTIGSSPITTSGTITLSIATASGSQNGLLSSSDWTTFNNKLSTATADATYVSLSATQTVGGFKTFSQAIKNDSGILLKNNVLSGQIGYTGLGSYTDGLTVQTSGSSFVNYLFFQSAGGYTYTFPTATGTLALTSQIPANPVGGTGTTNYLPKFTGASTIGNSAITDDGTTVTLVSRALSGTSATFSEKIQISSGGLRIGASAVENDRLIVVSGTNLTSGSTQYLEVIAPLYTGNITNLYGRLQYATCNSGTITNAYMMYVGSFVGTATYSNKWSIYQESTTEKNYFGGNVLIGTTTDAGYKLDVNGTGRFTDTLTGTTINLSSELTINRSTASSTYLIDLYNSHASNNAAYTTFRNAGVTMSVGVERSIGGAIINGGAYTGVITTVGTKDLNLATNEIIRLTLNGSTGAATFSSSVTTKGTGNYNGFVADNSSSATIGGGYFSAYSFGVQRGIFGVAGAISGAADNNMGIFAEGGLGIKFFVNGSGTASHIMTSGGNVLIGTTTDSGFKLDVSGTARVSGVVTLSNLTGTGSRAVLADASGVLSAPVSDISVKQNITSIGYGLSEILKMNPVWFDFIDEYKNYGEGRQNGNIAQEMAEIIPEAVFTTPSTGKMGINYDQLHAVYINAIKELKAEIEELKLKIK